MDTAAQKELLDRLIEFLDSGTDPMAPDVMLHPVDCYVAHDLAEAERTLLFEQFPVIVGYSSQVRSPGDFARHFRQISSRERGILGFSRRGRIGSRLSTCISVSRGLSSENGVRPVSNS